MRSTRSGEARTSPLHAKRRSDRGAAKLTVHPIAFAIAGLALAVAVGLGGYVASRLPQSSAGQSADAAGPTSTSTVHSMNAPQLPPTGSDLTFNATFAGSNLDTSVWDTCYW